MADARPKSLNITHKVEVAAWWLSGAIFLLGIAPFLSLTLLMKVHLIDPTLNPVVAGLAFVVSCPVFLVLLLTAVICRFVLSD